MLIKIVFKGWDSFKTSNSSRLLAFPKTLHAQCRLSINPYKQPKFGRVKVVLVFEHRKYDNPSPANQFQQNKILAYLQFDRIREFVIHGLSLSYRKNTKYEYIAF